MEWNNSKCQKCGEMQFKGKKRDKYINRSNKEIKNEFIMRNLKKINKLRKLISFSRILTEIYICKSKIKMQNARSLKKMNSWIKKKLL